MSTYINWSLEIESCCFGADSLGLQTQEKHELDQLLQEASRIAYRLASTVRSVTLSAAVFFVADRFRFILLQGSPLDHSRDRRYSLKRFQKRLAQTNPLPVSFTLRLVQPTYSAQCFENVNDGYCDLMYVNGWQ